LAPQQPLASARWLLGAGLATLGLALLCVYITFCLLFWQGQWQLVFKPSPAITSTPSSVGLKYDEIQFDATETGILQLNGWWIPSDQPATETLLFLHGNSGSLSDALPQLQILHQLGMNIFAFDYRGFGKSKNTHPSEKSTYEDADAAWNYLTGTRHLSASTIILDGVGLGAAVAAETARRHPQAPALILKNPQPPTLETLQWDSLTRLLPIRLLFHDRFDPTRTLAQMRTPKLLLYPANDTVARYYDQAAEPKQKANPAAGEALPVIKSFLAKYLPSATP
jgi:pimeloyl-ACP methyl ester carboxylesterase